MFGRSNFCQIETIANGTLVHYTAVFDPNEVSKLNPQEQLKEQVAEEVRKELHVEFRSLRKEDVILFCKDVAEVMKAVGEAYQNEQKRIRFEGANGAIRGCLGDYVSLAPSGPFASGAEKF